MCHCVILYGVRFDWANDIITMKCHMHTIQRYNKHLITLENLKIIGAATKLKLNIRCVHESISQVYLLV